MREKMDENLWKNPYRKEIPQMENQATNENNAN